MPPTAEATDSKRSISRRTPSTSIEDDRRVQEPERAGYQRTRYYFSPMEEADLPSELAVSQEPGRETRHWEEAGTSTIRLARNMRKLLERFYGLREPAEVVNFLSNNFFLFALLLQAYDWARKYFPSSKLFLEIIDEPEVEDTRMVISISTNLAPSEALNRLEQLDEDWWLTASSRAKGKLAITVEFR